jgi:hypothetical protein
MEEGSEAILEAPETTETTSSGVESIPPPSLARVRGSVGVTSTSEFSVESLDSAGLRVEEWVVAVEKETLQAVGGRDEEVGEVGGTCSPMLESVVATPSISPRLREVSPRVLALEGLQGRLAEMQVRHVTCTVSALGLKFLKDHLCRCQCTESPNKKGRKDDNCCSCPHMAFS